DRVMAAGADATWLTIWRGAESDGRPFSITIFQSGGTGARSSKDGLNATGFPSGVAGVPAEVIETLTPIVQHRRELRTDSGGAGAFRGGLGQAVEMSCRSGLSWSVSTLIDRVRYVPPGLAGGASGAPGEFALSSGEPAQEKSLVRLDPDVCVRLSPPGGSGYGDPRTRDVERVLADVVDGYISIESALEDYGVAIEYTGPPDRLVRTPDLYRVDLEATRRARGAGPMAGAGAQ